MDVAGVGYGAHGINGPDLRIRTQNINAPILEGSAIYSPVTLNDRLSIKNLLRTPSQDRRDNETDERELFSQLQKTRFRYDVEVVTKLIVYSGIWMIEQWHPLPR